MHKKKYEMYKIIHSKENHTLQKVKGTKVVFFDSGYIAYKK